MNYRMLEQLGHVVVLGLLLIAAPKAQADKLYWTDWAAKTIQRANLNGSGVETIVDAPIASPHAVVLDLAAGKMYWADSGTGKIQRAELNGSGVVDVVIGLSAPRAVAVDPAGFKIYWAETGANRIRRASLDGSNVEDLVSDVAEPQGIALDLSAGKMYWTEVARIRRANLDGNNVELVLSTPGGSPGELVLHAATGALYWVDRIAPLMGSVRRANLDGSNVANVASSPGIVKTSGLAVDAVAGKVYWGDGAQVRRSNLDGSNPQTVHSSVGSTAGIAIDPSGGQLYLAHDSAGKIRRADLNGGNLVQLVGGHNPFSFALDPDVGMMYFNSFDGSCNAAVERANLDGTGIETIVTVNEMIESIALDTGAGEVYWSARQACSSPATATRIRRVNFDGSNPTDVLVFAPDTVGPGVDGLALDVVAGKMYWGLTSQPPGSGTLYWIQRANLDGSNVETLVSQGIDRVIGISLDGAASKMYWIENGGFIRRANLNGTDVQTLWTGMTGSVAGITLDLPNGKIYWTSQSHSAIYRMNLNGTNWETVLTSADGLVAPFGVAVGPGCCRPYGDIAPLSPGMGGCVVDVDDISCSLAGFVNRLDCPDADISPCGGDGIIDVDDILSQVATFMGNPLCAHACP